MITFVQIAIGRCCAGPVRRRTWLGLGGVMLVISAGIAAYGINSAFGKTHNFDGYKYCQQYVVV